MDEANSWNNLSGKALRSIRNCKGNGSADLLAHGQRICAEYSTPESYRSGCYAAIDSRSSALTSIAACWLINSSVSTNRMLLLFLTRVP